MTDTKQETQITPMDALRKSLTQMKAEFAAALPPQIPADKFVRTTVTAIQMNTELINCDRKSLYASCMRAAQDGLLVDGREAALVIFNSKDGKMVQYMPMVAGIYKKIRNSGEVASISAHCVYEKDSFSYILGDEEKINHKPYLDGERGNVTAVYAIAKTKDGGIYREVMSKSDIEKVRNSSRAKNAGPWTQWYEEMARKTVIRRIAKRLPSSTDLEKVLENDNDVVGFERTPINVTPIQPVASTEPTDLIKKLGIPGLKKASEIEQPAPKQPSIDDAMDDNEKQGE